MRSDTDHREQLDDFSNFMRQKLEDHRLPIDDLCWEEIEARAGSRQPKWLWWAGSSVAAAVIAFLFLFSPFRGGDEFHEGMALPVVSMQDQETIHQEVEEDARKETVPVMDHPVPAKKLIAAVIPNDPQVTEEKELPDTDIVENEAEQDKSVGKTTAKEASTAPEKKPGKKSEQADLYNYDSKKYKFSSGSKKKKKEEGKWAVNAGFGTGGHVSLGLRDYDMASNDNQDGMNPGNPGIISPPPVKPPYLNGGGVLPPEDYTYVDAALPLSFGLTVRRDFNRYIGLETGLVYTYLASNLSKSGEVRYRSHLELHYLGVPVNLVVNLWQNDRWNIYLSGGIMLEKGLRAKQTEDRFWQMELYDKVDKRGINGVQWSLNASAGVSYRFYKNWSFYFEPRISHYFDNDQPTSIRTENSVIMGLGAGVRFGF